MKSAKEKAIEIIEAAGGLIRTKEALEKGVHRRTLYGLCAEGTIIRISRGLYQLSDIEIPAQIGLAEIAKRVPNGIICLISALAFHELTTQTPHYVWMAVERKTRKPKIEYPPLRVFFFSGDMFSRGDNDS